MGRGIAALAVAGPSPTTCHQPRKIAGCSATPFPRQTAHEPPRLPPPFSDPRRLHAWAGSHTVTGRSSSSSSSRLQNKGEAEGLHRQHGSPHPPEPTAASPGEALPPVPLTLKGGPSGDAAGRAERVTADRCHRPGEGREECGSCCRRATPSTA